MVHGTNLIPGQVPVPEQFFRFVCNSKNLQSGGVGATSLSLPQQVSQRGAVEISGRKERDEWTL